VDCPSCWNGGGPADRHDPRGPCTLPPLIGSVAGSMRRMTAIGPIQRC